MEIQSDRQPWNLRALLEATATPFTVADYRPRAAIYRVGDRCENVMHIERGRVWLAVTAPSGKEAICGLVDAGAFLGEEALTGCGERRQSATAMTPTRVLVIAKGHMLRLVRTQPELTDELVAHILARGIRLEASLREQLLYSSEERLAHLLLVLADCDRRRPCRCGLPDLSQAILGEMVGTTRSRVNFFMRRFKKRGFIEETRGVLHVNSTRLHAVHDDERHAAAATTAAER
jgi:CRP-like cAMP-binding protein